MRRAHSQVVEGGLWASPIEPLRPLEHDLLPVLPFAGLHKEKVRKVSENEPDQQRLTPGNMQRHVKAPHNQYFDKNTSIGNKIKRGNGSKPT